jgi:hypothetical protein
MEDCKMDVLFIVLTFLFFALSILYLIFLSEERR